ncbi:hypothetical protein L6452_17353 [Arctium lappa]|uniref:Uncharacterized protein n=1 Tax=Arctium lappa TaxID=4217 RepID=A0ACB9C3G3_ARCLA|nr:hypothetical protein L6452_17353 [Arctium lappa]
MYVVVTTTGVGLKYFESFSRWGSYTIRSKLLDCGSARLEGNPLFLKIDQGHPKSTLRHQENRILGEIVEEKIAQIFAVVFENYKFLDQASPSGII